MTAGGAAAEGGAASLFLDGFCSTHSVAGLQKRPRLKKNPTLWDLLGLLVFLLKSRLIRRPSLTGSGISVGFQLLE